MSDVILTKVKAVPSPAPRTRLRQRSKLCPYLEIIRLRHKLHYDLEQQLRWLMAEYVILELVPWRRRARTSFGALRVGPSPPRLGPRRTGRSPLHLHRGPVAPMMQCTGTRAPVHPCHACTMPWTRRGHREPGRARLSRDSLVSEARYCRSVQFVVCMPDVVSARHGCESDVRDRER